MSTAPPCIPIFYTCMQTPRTKPHKHTNVQPEAAAQNPHDHDQRQCVLGSRDLRGCVVVVRPAQAAPQGDHLAHQLAEALRLRTRAKVRLCIALCHPEPMHATTISVIRRVRPSAMEVDATIYAVRDIYRGVWCDARAWMMPWVPTRAEISTYTKPLQIRHEEQI